MQTVRPRPRASVCRTVAEQKVQGTVVEMAKTEALVVEVERVMTLAHPLPDVVDFLADFSNTTSWDPGTVTCDRIGGGELSVGAEWHNVSQFRGRRTELRYRLVRFEPGRLTF